MPNRSKGITTFSRQTVIRAAVVLALLVITVAAGVYWFTRTRDSVTELNRQLEQFREVGEAGERIEERSGGAAREAANRLPGVLLPDSASDVRYARQGDVKPAYWLRFRLPPGALGAFLAETCFNAPLTEGSRPSFAYADNPAMIVNLDWWTPDEAQVVAGGSCALREDVSFNLLVDETDPALLAVYLEIITR